jgi:putative membrane protein
MSTSKFSLHGIFSLAGLATSTLVWALTSSDTQFVSEAAMGGMTEVALGKLSENSAASSTVKEFGARMVDDHTKANDQLAGISRDKGVTAPAQLDAKHQKLVDHMSQLKGAAFDRAFMTQMLADHRSTIALFKREAASGKDADLKSFAQKTLPTLESHLQMAQQADKVAVSN